MSDPLVVVRLPLAELRQDPQNVRLHPDRNLAAIAHSLRLFGQQTPITITQDRVVLKGNGTLAAARELGWTHLDCVVTELAGPQARAYAIADNRTAELAEWDEGALGLALQELDEGLLAGTGFTGDEMRAALDAGGHATITEDEAPLPPDVPTSRRGDLWVIGSHRLLCGDSSVDADLDRLLAGQPVHLVNMDPPYNVKVEPRSNNAIAAGLSTFAPQKQTHHQKLDVERHPEKAKPTTKQMRAKDRPIANDFIEPAEFERILRLWFKNAARVLIPGGGFYIWGGYVNCSNYPPALVEAKLYFSQAIIWVKRHAVLTRKDFMGDHEWCFYGWKEGAAHRWFGPNNATDVWEVKKLNHTAMVHLTEKPVELAARAIQYSSQPGENVLDLFGGSGSTTAACQQTGRRGHSIELDEAYCDVIVERLQKLCGVAARLDGDGRTFEDVKASRATG